MMTAMKADFTMEGEKKYRLKPTEKEMMIQ